MSSPASNTPTPRGVSYPAVLHVRADLYGSGVVLGCDSRQRLRQSLASTAQSDAPQVSLGVGGSRQPRPSQLLSGQFATPSSEWLRSNRHMSVLSAVSLRGVSGVTHNRPPGTRPSLRKPREPSCASSYRAGDELGASRLCRRLLHSPTMAHLVPPVKGQS